MIKNFSKKINYKRIYYIYYYDYYFDYSENEMNDYKLFDLYIAYLKTLLLFKIDLIKLDYEKEELGFLQSYYDA